jgi:hypothetical protein
MPNLGDIVVFADEQVNKLILPFPHDGERIFAEASFRSNGYLPNVSSCSGIRI